MQPKQLKTPHTKRLAENETAKMAQSN